MKSDLRVMTQGARFTGLRLGFGFALAFFGMASVWHGAKLGARGLDFKLHHYRTFQSRRAFEDVQQIALSIFTVSNFVA